MHLGAMGFQNLKVESLEGACQALEEVWKVYHRDGMQKSQA